MLLPSERTRFSLISLFNPSLRRLKVVCAVAVITLLSITIHFTPNDDSRRNVLHTIFSGKKSNLERHILRDDGLLEVNPRGRHPILNLMEAAEKEWNEKVSRQSRTFDQAVKEYERRYQRRPPKGFNLWWKYVQANNVPLPDEYDRINHDISPLLGINPSSLHTLLASEESFKISQGSAWIIVKNSTHPLGSINREGDYRLGVQMPMLKLVEEFLPDFRMILSVHDVPQRVMGYEQRRELIEAAKSKNYTDGTNSHPSSPSTPEWADACPPQSALHTLLSHPNSSNISSPIPSPKTFIHNHSTTMSPCTQPSLLLNTGLFSLSHHQSTRPHPEHLPIFTLSTTHMHGDILVPPAVQWVSDIEVDREWEEKVDDRLLWRGSPTGMILSADHPEWRTSQRMRLVNTTRLSRLGSEYILLPDDLSPIPVEMSAGRLNTQLMDISFTGSPPQCGNRKGDTTCAEVMREFEFRRKQSFKEAGLYKFVMDIDGNGWSGRFKRLLTSHALVFKATVHPEWFTERIVPWYHYVPIQMDLSDLYDTTLFFHSPAHDTLAKRIATQGREWSMTHWRMEDMAAYMLRLLLEYARAMSIDRDSMDLEVDASV